MIAPHTKITIRCKPHGPMMYRPSLCKWECVGLDGEGCSTALTDEDLHKIVTLEPKFVQLNLDQLEVIVEPAISQKVNAYMLWSE